MPTLTEQDFTFKTKPLKHQLEALCQSATKTNFAYLMEMGCVDGETEFLSNTGWIKFKDFNIKTIDEYFRIAQVVDPIYNDDYKMSLEYVLPSAYIYKTVYKMYQLTGTTPNNRKPCLDMVVTPDHIMHCQTRHYDKVLNKMKDDVTAEQLVTLLKQRPEAQKTRLYEGYRGEVMQRLWGFNTDKEVRPIPEARKIYNLNPWELRVLVAVIADGNFPRKDSDKCILEFSKPNKIERFEYLCKRAGILAVKESIRGGKSTRFQIIAPIHKKVYDECFWTLTEEQFNTIFDEVFRWDGSIEPTRNRFYTIHKKSADFVQFLCCINGYRATIIHGTSNNAPYYTVSYNPNYDLENIDYDKFTTITSFKEVEPLADRAYCFRVPSGNLLLRRNDTIFVTGNSGKTKVIIDNMAYLKKRNAITGALVMAPKGVYRNWSTQEIPKHMPEDVNPDILVWKADASSSYKNKLLERIKSYDGTTFPILVFNIESLLSTIGVETIKQFLRVHYNRTMGIIDESTCIKNHKAKRTKKALEIGSKCRVRRIATGSPITNSPLDLFSQFAFLDKKILGCGSFYAFRNIYAEIERITTRQGQSFDKILKYKNLPMLANRIKGFSYRITKKECLELPDKVYIVREVELTPEQKKVYNEMKDLSFATDGEDIMSVQVALTKILRLHQILCGSFTTDDGKSKRIPNHRLKALEEVLDETGTKTIIWANYLQNIADIKELLTEKYGKESFVVYTGETTSDERVEAIRLFQNANSPVRFFLGNVQTAGRGITLTAASTVVYYSNNYSLEMRQQSEDRAHRVGQTKSVTYVDLVVRDSLDEKIIKSLLAKRNIANEILHDDLEDWIKL